MLLSRSVIVGFNLKKMKTVILVGAGSTLSDAGSKPKKDKPPLDRGFFSGCEKLGHKEFPSIQKYLITNYDIDPVSIEHDSLERIMAIIYADINNPILQNSAVEAFRNIIRLFNRRIAETTNSLNISNRSNLFRIIAKKLSSGITPDDLSIITFNQDIHIEKTLEKIQSTKKYSSYGSIFSFPDCYRIDGASSRLSRPRGKASMFPTLVNPDQGISIYKLHGSLNWFSTHTSQDVPKRAILSRTKKFKITPRKYLKVGMTFTAGKRTSHTFPLIIPPVNHKAAIIHEDLHPLWEQAEIRLREADEIIVFGYSCPPTDFESANMLRRATNSGVNPQSFVVIDPSPSTFHRYIDVTCLNHLAFFRDCNAYIEKG